RASTQETNNEDLAAKGRQIFGVACVQCHGAGHTVIQRKPAAGWRKTVYTMISRGAPVLLGETVALVAYLTSTYGPASPPPHLQHASALSQPLRPGSELVASSCGTCHPSAVVFGSRKSKNAWETTIKQMRTLGASITDAQEKEILDYLLRNFGAQ